MIHLLQTILFLVIIVILYILTLRNIPKLTGTKKQILSYIGVSVLAMTALGINFISYQQTLQVSNNKETKELTYKPTTDDATQDFSKQSAVSFLVDALKEFDKTKDGFDISIEKKFTDIAKDDKKPQDYLTDKALDLLYMKDIMATDEAYKTASLTMLGFIELMNQAGNKELAIKNPNENIVYLDEVTHTAYVPLDVFSGTQSSMSIQLVYINGKWKINPYTFIQEIQLSDFVQQLTEQKIKAQTQTQN